MRGKIDENPWWFLHPFTPKKKAGESKSYKTLLLPLLLAAVARRL
jgi:hypothetical protein